MDKTAMIAAIKAAMPGLSDAMLNALSDDQLAELAKNLPTPAATTPAATGVTTNADEGAMSRDELITELTALGQDPTALAAMSDEDLQAMYDQLTSDANGDSGTTTDAAAAMSDKTRCATMGEKGKKTPFQIASEKALANIKKVNTFAEQQLKRARQINFETKKRKVETFCEELVKGEKLLPWMRDLIVKPYLTGLDDNRADHTFSENGVSKKLTRLDHVIESLKKSATKVVTFGEKIGVGADSKQASEAEVRKVEKFAELQGGALRRAGTDPKKLVETAKKMAENDPDFTAAKLIGKDGVAMVG